MLMVGRLIFVADFFNGTLYIPFGREHLHVDVMGNLAKNRLNGF
jgi:hypothetical protein